MLLLIKVSKQYLKCPVIRIQGVWSFGGRMRKMTKTDGGIDTTFIH